MYMYAPSLHSSPATPLLRHGAHVIDPRAKSPPPTNHNKEKLTSRRTTAAQPMRNRRVTADKRDHLATCPSPLGARLVTAEATWLAFEARPSKRWCTADISPALRHQRRHTSSTSDHRSSDHR